MKKTIFLLVLAFAGFSMKSQSDAALRHRNQTKKMSAKNESIVTQYANLESDILEKLISKEIPGNFPTYDGKKQTIDNYKESINVWAKENAAFIKPEHRGSFFTTANSQSK